MWLSLRAVVTGMVVSSVSLGVPLLAQTTRTVQACTGGVLSNCANIRWSSWASSAVGMTTLEIAVSNLGSLSQPLLATSVYNFVFWTGLPADAIFVDALVAPVAQGGATLSDPTGWNVYTAGDAIFLSALTNRGIGNCVTGTPQGGFGQAAQTCGSGQSISFTFDAPYAFDVTQFGIANMEVVGLDPALPADSCGDPSLPCAITEIPATTTPEPTTLALLAPGAVAMIWLRRRIRSA